MPASSVLREPDVLELLVGEVTRGRDQFFTLAQCTTFRDHQRPGMWYAFSSTIFWSSMTSRLRSAGSSVRACREYRSSIAGLEKRAQFCEDPVMYGASS